MIILFTADYVEGQPQTYKGIALSIKCKRVGYIATTGSFKNDLKLANELAEQLGMPACYTSSIDHYYQEYEQESD